MGSDASSPLVVDLGANGIPDLVTGNRVNANLSVRLGIGTVFSFPVLETQHTTDSRRQVRGVCHPGVG